MEKINVAKKIVDVMALNPIPVEKESMDTPIANKNMFMRVIFFSFVSG